MFCTPKSVATRPRIYYHALSKLSFLYSVIVKGLLHTLLNTLNFFTQAVSPILAITVIDSIAVCSGFGMYRLHCSHLKSLKLWQYWPKSDVKKHTCRYLLTIISSNVFNFCEHVRTSLLSVRPNIYN